MSSHHANSVPPVVRELARGLAAVLAMLWEVPAGCATEVEAASEILNLARSLAAVESGEPTTRSEGARWALANLDARWHPIIRRAQAVRAGATVETDDGTLREALPDLERALRALYRGLDGTGPAT